MVENNNSSNVRLGVFVVAGLLLLIATLYFMGQKRNMFGQSVAVSAIFNNVSGLQKGNLVHFNGIAVGTVKRVVLLSPTAIRVDMTIEEEASRYIPEAAIAQIGTEGLMGNKIVSLVATGAIKSAPVQSGTQLQVRQAVEVDSVLSSLNETSLYALTLTRNLAAISEHLQKGRGPMGRILMDTVLADKLDFTMDELQRTSTQSKRAVQDLSRVVADVKNGKGVVGMVLTDTAVRNELEEIIRQFSLASQQSAQLSQELLAASKQLREGEGVAQLILSDTAFANEMGASLTELREGAARFNENMAALQHNFLLRRYFRKKARKQEQAEQLPTVRSMVED